MRLASVATEGKLVAVGCEDGSIRFADVSNADVDEKKVFQGPSAPVTALAFAGRANALVSGAKDGSLRVWNVANGKAKHEISAGKEAIVAVAIHPKGKWFATGNLFGDVRVWSLDKGTQLAEFAAGSELALRGLFVLDGGKTLGVSRGGPTVVAYDVSKL
jgi:WD40 repeat protein